MPGIEIQPNVIEIKDKPTYPYDAVIVLGGGLHKKGEAYYPTDYQHSDEFGMLGAGIRMVAAINMYLNRQTNNFVFSTGVTAKNQEKFGEEVPTEASVYKNKFLRILKGLRGRTRYQERFNGLEEPVVEEEDRSNNTASNIQEVLQLVKDKDWKRVAIVSSGYHMPRLEALYNHVLAEHEELDVTIDFINAEEYVTEVEPGRYNDVIKRFTNPETNPKAAIRDENERRGLDDFETGRYHLGEFQLKSA